jgi:hypothetical protein
MISICFFTSHKNKIEFFFCGQDVSLGVTNARQIDTGVASGEDKNTLGVRTMSRDAAQIKRRVSVHQGSLILESCSYVWRVSVREEMECETTRSHCEQSAGTVNRVRSPGGEI